MLLLLLACAAPVATTPVEAGPVEAGPVEAGLALTAPSGPSLQLETIDAEIWMHGGDGDGWPLTLDWVLRLEVQNDGDVPLTLSALSWTAVGGGLSLSGEAAFSREIAPGERAEILSDAYLPTERSEAARAPLRVEGELAWRPNTGAAQETRLLFGLDVQAKR